MENRRRNCKKLCGMLRVKIMKSTLYIQGSEEAKKENERHVCNR